MAKPRKFSVALGAAGLLTVSSLGSVTAQDLTPVSMVLQWVPQAQFAGYYAADALGYYEEQGLDVTFIDGGPEVFPQVEGSQPDGPEFATSWVPRVLRVRDAGQSDLVNIGQVFQRSATLSASWADDPVASPEEFAGKTVGVWGGGNELEVFAAARAAGLEPDEDFDTVIQSFTMDQLLNREIDVAEAMTYNEYAQLLETINPDTGALYQPDDFVIIDYNEVGTAMLQDAIHARASWLAEEGNDDIAVRFLTASFKGWAYCRDNPEECVQITFDAGSTLGLGHQRWMMNEINPLIWPSPDGIGAMPQEEYEKTVQIAVDSGFLSEAPSDDYYRTDLAEAARAVLEAEGIELTGEGFEKGTVEVTEGGA
jgi:NitT/TauT family transport system substrate-binding protein